MSISFIQAFLVALTYFASQCLWTPNLGYYTIYRPLVGGAIVGLILGNLEMGITMGISIQLINMGFISAGGAYPSNLGFAGIVGTAFGIALVPTYGDEALTVALAMSVPLGMLGNLLGVGKMTWNALFMQPAEKAAKAGDRRGIFLWQWLIPQIVEGIVSIVPITIFVMSLGNEAVIAGLNSVIEILLKPLSGVAMLLPCLGLGTLLVTIGNKRTLPFFIIGFVVSQYLGISVIGLSVIAAMVAYLMTFGKGQEKDELEDLDDELPELE